MSNSCWEKLKDHLIGTAEYFNKPVRINQDEFVVMTQNDDKEEIERYNVKTQVWDLMHSFESDKIDNDKLLAFHDENTHSLYMLSANGYAPNYLFTLNLNSMTMNSSELKLDFWGSDEIQMIEQHLHFVATEGHSIFDISQNQFISECVEIADHGGLNDGQLIYLKKWNILLYFGGFNAHENHDIDQIHKYSWINKEWESLFCKLPLELEEFCCVSTNDERFVFILAGSSYDGDDFNYSYIDKIMIYDVEKEIIRESNVTLPDEAVDNTIHAVSMFEDTNLLVNGYVRGFMEIPKDIIQLIDNFVWMEYIYLMIQCWKNDDNFWRILVDDILR